MLTRLEFQFSDLDELRAEARRLSEKIFFPGMASVLVLLSGDLGAGKTEFVKQMLEGRGYGPITSPTYTLQHTYRSDQFAMEIHHFDFYRLKTKTEFEDFDFFRLLSEPTNHLFVEWPKWDLTRDLFLEKLDRDVFQIHLFRKFDRSS